MMLAEKLIRRVNLFFVGIAGLFLAVMILLTCANIFLRIVWVPIKGTYELMGFFSAIVTAFALGYAQMKKAHIAVDILISHFGEKTRRVLKGINSFVCMIFFSMAGWQIAKWATTIRATGEVTETLRIDYYPFTYGVALGCILLGLVLLLEFLSVLKTSGEKR